MARRVPLQNPAAAIRCLEDEGGVILTDFSTVDDVQQVNTDAAPYIDAIIQERARTNLPRETTRCSRLFGRSITARESWLQQPDLLHIIQHFLRTVSRPYNDATDTDISTEAILSAAATLDIGPGVKAQDLHRDEFIWQHTQTVEKIRDNYERGQDISMGLLVPGVDTHRANGATLFIPGSHLWPHSRRPMIEESAAAEMQVGEAFIFLGSTVHAGGANITPEPRPVHGFFFCRSWLRPEENQHLWFSREEVKKWSVAAQKQAGYVLDNPFLGHCNEHDPLDLFRASDASIRDV